MTIANLPGTEWTELGPGRGVMVACVLAALVTADTIGAQCPDGTPPPCRSAAQASAARRPNPQLNERAWIVVPFANATRTPDLDWLRDASVNLLSLDLSRWTDISVVDDKHVADLLREQPGTKGTHAMTLNDGIALARRAGAGRLVMGDFYKQGKGARLVANVFDVKTSARVRSATAQTVDADSLLTLFGHLARGALDVPPPLDGHVGAPGTTRLDAYHAYREGVRALYRFELPEARAGLRRALALDSTFALAHLNLAMVQEFSERAADRDTARVHAKAAQALGASLPPRERTLIAAAVAATSSDYTRACELLAPLIQRDSTDVQALYAFGDCAYHDATVVAPAIDTMPGRYRWGWNTSLRALSRVLELDPTFHIAFEHILDILSTSVAPGCVRRSMTVPCEEWRAAVRRDERGDSLLLEPIRWGGSGVDRWFRQLSEMTRDRPMKANLARAQQIAESWAAANPNGERAQFALARVRLARGDVNGAAEHLARVQTSARSDAFNELLVRMEVAAKSGHGAEARAWLDSAEKAVPADSSSRTERGAFNLLFGRVGPATAALTARSAPLGAEAVAYAREVPLVVVGVPRPSAGAAEAAYLASFPDTVTCRAACRVGRLQATLWFAPRIARPAGGNWAFAEHDPRSSTTWFLMNRDTVGLRRATRVSDSTAHANVQMGWSDNNRGVFATDGYVALHDSAAALASARFYVDSAMAVSPWTMFLVNGMYAPVLWPRMMLLRADLAAALGFPDEARVWYARVLDLWAEADVELQPTVVRVRRALAARGGRGGTTP